MTTTHAALYEAEEQSDGRVSLHSGNDRDEYQVKQRDDLVKIETPIHHPPSGIARDSTDDATIKRDVQEAAGVRIVPSRARRIPERYREEEPQWASDMNTALVDPDEEAGGGMDRSDYKEEQKNEKSLDLPPPHHSPPPSPERKKIRVEEPQEQPILDTHIPRNVPDSVQVCFLIDYLNIGCIHCCTRWHRLGDNRSNQ